MTGTAVGRASLVEQQCDQLRRIIEETIPDSYEREQIVVELRALTRRAVTVIMAE